MGTPRARGGRRRGCRVRQDLGCEELADRLGKFRRVEDAVAAEVEFREGLRGLRRDLAAVRRFFARDDAELLVRELFGNSIRHSGSGAPGETVTVAVRSGDGVVRAEVTDRTWSPPVNSRTRNKSDMDLAILRS
jgi:hypothetical protein